MPAQLARRLIALFVLVLLLVPPFGERSAESNFRTALAQGTCPVNQFRAEYFANATLSGSPVVVRCESQINYRWGTKAPVTGLPADQFSVRWTGTHRFQAGKYRFTATVDDGVRFLLDGKLTLSEWRSQSTTFVRDRDLAAGDHEIVVEYFEGGGSATAVFGWQLLSSDPGTGPTATPTPTVGAPTSTPTVGAPTPTRTPTQGTSGCPVGQYRAEYFANATLNGTPQRTQCEDGIAYRWGTGGPTGVGTDNFSVRWEGRHQFSAGTHRFRVFSDDGVRVWIDGTLVLDEWQGQAAGWEFDRALSAGEHTVKVEYYEGGGGATIEVGWVLGSGGSTPTPTRTPSATTPPATPTPTTGTCPLGQYRAEYFANDTFGGAPVASRCEAAPIRADWQYGAPYASLPRDSFSVRYVGRFKFVAGDHTFTASVDDGVRVWLNGTLLIDNGANRPGTYTATRNFPPGVVGEEHEVRVEFVEKGGIAKVAFDWAAGSTSQPTSTPVPTPSGTPTGACPPTEIRLPSGFCIQDFATGLTAVRLMAYGPDGVLYASLPSEGRVVRLPDANRDGRADGVYTFAAGLNRPHGLAFHNGYLYVAETDSLTRLRDTDGDGDSDQIQRLAPLPGGSVHWTRTVIVGSDGKLYVSIGSSCDACIETDPRRATVMQFNADGSGGRVYSRGLRNAVGLALHPSTGQIWAVGNERDGMGDDFPREILSRLIDGADFGWPRCANGNVPDTRFTGGCGGVTPPVMTFQAHSAPLGHDFYTGTAFPSEYRDDLYIAFHGSWNRSVPTGYKVVRVPFSNGQPSGQVFDFATGWLESNGTVTGRPVDVITAPDGSLMVSDDRANRIYRIWYRGAP